MCTCVNVYVGTGDVEVEAIDLERDFDFLMRAYRNDFKRCIRKVADEIADDVYRRKPLEELPNLEELENMITPEDVCLMERGASVDQRLLALGIEQVLDVSRLELALSRMNKLKDFMRSRLKACAEMVGIHRGTARGKELARLEDILTLTRDRLKKEIEVGRLV